MVEDPFRWTLLALLIVNLGMSGIFRRRARAVETIERSSESPGLIALRLAFTLPLLLSLLAYLIRPAWMAWSQVSLPAWARWSGAALGALTVPLNLWVLRSLGKNISETVRTKESHELVTHGPYRWVRHPLYTAGLVLLTSAALLMASWVVAALAVAIAMGILWIVIPPEEEALIEKFGQRYREHKARTGRLLPRWSRPSA